MNQCDHPKDKRAKSCLACHARRNALRNHATGAVQSDAARAKRTASYLATRVGYVPDGQADLNRIMRNNHICTAERKRIFAQQAIAEYDRAAAERQRRIKRDEY